MQNLLRVDYEDVSFWGWQWPNWPHGYSFGKNHYYNSMHLLISFIVQYFLKILTVDQELWWNIIFGPKVVHLHLNRFSGKPLKYTSCNFSPISLCKIEKKKLSKSRVKMVDHLAPKMSRLYFFPRKPLM